MLVKKCKEIYCWYSSSAQKFREDNNGIARCLPKAKEIKIDEGYDTLKPTE